MESASNSEAIDNVKLDKEIAKKTLSNVFEKIFPALMSFGQAEKLSETSKSNIQRAAQGQTLLNARAAAMIIKSAFKVRTLFEVRSFILDCPQLNLYFQQELGEEYSNPEYKSKEVSWNVTNSIITHNTRKVYGLLYTHKHLSKDILATFLGENETQLILNNLEKHKIITYDRKFEMIHFNEGMVTSSFLHNKIQLELIASEIDDESIKKGEAIYGQDIILMTPEDAKQFLSMNDTNDQKNFEFIRHSENKNIQERTTMVDYSLIVNTKWKIGSTLLKREVQ